MIPTVTWRDDAVRILDQTLLPEREVYLDLTSLEDLCEAIHSLRVRGAPAIGICAAYGVALLARGGGDTLERDVRRLRSVRPTAVNLAWAVDRVWRRCAEARTAGGSSAEAARAALAEARALHEEDLAASRAMGGHGAELVQPGGRILTHCNTGGLATGGLGTALAVAFEAARQGKRPHVYAAETRPLLQGARLTAWELAREGIAVTVLVDGARAHLMATLGIDLVLVGADRVAANGDTANKIGTLAGAICAQRYGVPVYVVAPGSSFDLTAADGADLPVELRDGDEVRRCGDRLTAPREVAAWNPAFDVTPADLIRGWITEHGVLQPPFDALRTR